MNGGAAPPEDALGEQQLPEASRSKRLVDLLAGNLRKNIDRYRVHRPAVFDGDIIIFSAIGGGGDRSGFLSRSWRPHVSGEVLMYSIDCAHDEMLTHDSVGLYGQRLRHLLVLAERRLELAHGGQQAAAAREDKVPGARRVILRTPKCR
ncbi:hypothetical protein [Mycobacterium paraffinicum]|jgi:hypothetical protein|nr:hypothetical protein [Mycobacterium paraffinicum]MCV7309180.1 hypothetical protein [Mycobacterium paraffinicum]